MLRERERRQFVTAAEGPQLELQESYGVRKSKGFAGRRLPRGERGLSLLETLLATFMFVTVMISLMDVWVAHSRAFDKSQGQEVAAFLCQQVMEQSMASGYNLIPVASQPLVWGAPYSFAPVNFIVKRTMRGVPEDSTFVYNVTCFGPGGTEAPPADVGVNPYITPPAFIAIVCQVFWSDSTGNHTMTMESDAGW